MPRCEQCGREFKNDLALKIHVGKQHGKGRKQRTMARELADRPANAVKTDLARRFTCKKCGRTFSLAMHLGRHMSLAHLKAPTAKKARKASKRSKPRLRVPVAADGPDIAFLDIDQLLLLKQQVDARLHDVARQLRLVKVRL
jgi:uncharacterized C2H2 Zn-finger protein